MKKYRVLVHVIDESIAELEVETDSVEAVTEHTYGNDAKHIRVRAYGAAQHRVLEAREGTFTDEEVKKWLSQLSTNLEVPPA